MKKIVLTLLFVFGLVQCQNLPTYQDVFQHVKLHQEAWNTPQRIKVLEARRKFAACTGLLYQELERCQLAKDCEKSEKLLTLYFEHLKAGKECSLAKKSA